MNRLSFICLALFIVITVIYTKSAIKRILGHKDDNEHEAEKENVLISGESVDSSIIISKETARDIYSKIKLIRPIMFASIIFNILFMDVPPFRWGLLELFGENIMNYNFATLILLGIFSYFFGWLEYKMGVRFATHTFFYLMFLCFLFPLYSAC